MVKTINYKNNIEKLKLAIKDLETRWSTKIEKATIKHNKELNNLNKHFADLITKKKAQLIDIDAGVLDVPVVIDGISFNYQKEIDEYKKTIKYKINNIEHRLQCHICKRYFFGYTLSMYKQSPFSKKKETKYYKHMQQNGGTCIKHCVKCEEEFLTIKGKLKHKCKGETISFDKNYDNSYVETDTDSNVSITISESSSSSEEEIYEIESETEAETDAVAIIDYSVNYINDDGQFRINGNLYDHIIGKNKVFDCLGNYVGKVENNYLILI